MSVTPSLFPGDSQVPPCISEHSEAFWVLAAPQKTSGEGTASGAAHFFLFAPTAISY